MEYGLDNIIVNSLSVIILIISLAVFARMKDKQQLHYLFLFNDIFLLIWVSFRFAEEIAYSLTYKNYEVLIGIFNVGANFIPLSLLLSCIVHIRGKIKFNIYYILLLIPPIVSLLFAFTNNIHGQYYIKYTSYLNKNVYGPAYFFHIAYSYIYISSGIYYVFRSLKDVEFISKQTIFLMTGILVPAITYCLITFKIMNLPLYVESLLFAFSAIVILFSVNKHKFLNIVPVALNTIFNNITDCVLLINNNFTILEYNDNFKDRFKININKYSSFLEAVENKPLCLIKEDLFDIIYKSINNKSIEVLEIKIDADYFNVEVSSVYTEYMITVIVIFKDITENKKYLELMKQNQKQIVERERLISLNQMIGGIAHNLKTPLMSSAGGVHALKKYTKRIEDSVSNNNYSNIKQDIDKMYTWVNKVKEYLVYMSDVITTVKGQTVNTYPDADDRFTISKLMEKFHMLMDFELKKNKITLKKNFNIDLDATSIRGDINSLIQVFNNLVNNAIESSSNEIEICINQNGDNIVFEIRDFGVGISNDIKEKLFKQMITSKGKNGTGLGLYISNSIITAKFNGTLVCESEPGKGTTFYIHIPLEGEHYVTEFQNNYHR